MSRTVTPSGRQSTQKESALPLAKTLLGRTLIQEVLRLLREGRGGDTVREPLRLLRTNEMCTLASGPVHFPTTGRSGLGLDRGLRLELVKGGSGPKPRGTSRPSTPPRLLPRRSLSAPSLPDPSADLVGGGGGVLSRVRTPLLCDVFPPQDSEDLGRRGRVS